jgi:hypothetical protein
MPVLIAIVAVIGVVCLIDLLLTVGVIRRLREHTTMLSASNIPDTPIIGVHVGEAPDAFTAVSTSGHPVENGSDLGVVAFFSTACSICPERVPVFVDYLAKHKVPPARVLAVVGGHESRPAPYLATLERVAQVCTEPEDGPLARAFKVVGFPAFCLVDAEGNVLATDYTPAHMPAPFVGLSTAGN